MLTTFDLDEYVFGALRAGASGFLLKDAPADELANAVRVVAAGRLAARPGRDPAGHRRVRARDRAATPAEAPSGWRAAHATGARGARSAGARACPTCDIARALFVSEATTKTHVSNILAKLRVTDRVQAVIAAYESGVVTPGSRDPSHD